MCYSTQLNAWLNQFKFEYEENNFLKNGCYNLQIYLKKNYTKNKVCQKNDTKKL